MAKFCQDLRRKDRSCLPLVKNDYCSPYEMRECFPCLTSPISYFIVDRFPFVQWLSRYTLSCLVSDIIAGLTVGLMVVPQALAYASIAQLPLEVLEIETDICYNQYRLLVVRPLLRLHGLLRVHNIWDIQGCHARAYCNNVSTSSIQGYQHTSGGQR